MRRTDVKIRSIIAQRLTLPLALLRSCGVLVATVGTQAVLAGSGGKRVQSEDVRFTKWMTSDQDMAGVLTGGTAGTGTFSGEILNVITSTPELWEGEVQYQIHGTTHQFSAHIHVMENVVTNKATLDGVITEGWLHGRAVHGEYDTISSCPENPHQPPDPLSPCILVTLHIEVGD
jgi:hypothetical protein